MMKVYRALLFLVGPLLVLQLAAAAPVADGALSVNEDATLLEFTHDGIELKIAVVNPASQSVPAVVELDFVTPEGAVVKSARRNVALKPQSNLLTFKFDNSFAGISKPAVDDFHWFRLRYRLSRQGGAPTVPVSGVISVSRITVRTFRLQIATPENVVEGERIHVPVFTLASGSGRPVPNVAIEGTLTVSDFDDESRDLVQTVRTRTGSHGDSMLTFQLPADLEDADIALKVRASRGSEVREVEEELYTDERSAQVVITTDKPIYQPGQRLNMRVLAFKASGSPLAQEILALEVRGPESVSFSADLKTSRFGEAHTDWVIPESIRAGTYSISVENSGGDRLGSASVKVEPYDLPVFTIRTRSDRPYYLPGQKAEVDVQSNYLFGQPVPGALVKVVETSSPSYAYYRRQTAAPTPVIEGIANAKGSFVATIDPWKPTTHWPEMRGERFEDRHFIAYVTDPVSKRSEERRFDIRASRAPIHVYLTPPQRRGGDGEVELLVATQYADGSPVSCTVEIRLADRGGFEREPETAGSLITSVKTDQFGVARIRNLRPPDSGQVLFTADDGKGNRGWKVGDVDAGDDVDVEVETDKMVYATGEPLRLEIRSIHQNGPVILDLLDGIRPLETRIVHLEGGAASLTIPYSNRFRGELAVVAQYAGASEQGESHRRIVSYPGVSGLTVDAVSEKATYAPGDEARVAFRVRRPDGASGASLLGVVVRDRAVDERSQTAYDRVPRSSLDEIIGRELSRIDRTRSLPPALQAATEFVMVQRAQRARYGNGEREFSEDGPNPDATSSYREYINRQFARLQEALRPTSAQNRRSLPTEVSLRELLVETGTDHLLDPWDVPYRVRMDQPYGDRVNLVFHSAGPDHQPDTSDDFAVFSAGWPVFQARGALLKRAVDEYRKRSGVFVRDIDSLRAAVREVGEDIDAWLDFWGKPYEFKFTTEHLFTLSVLSRNPKEPSRPGATVWTAVFNYGEEVFRKIEPAVLRYVWNNGALPATEAQFDEALRSAELSQAALADPWGHPYYVTIDKAQEVRDLYLLPTGLVSFVEFPYSLYVNHNQPGFWSTFPGGHKLVIRSLGPDGGRSNDDFDVAVLVSLGPPEAGSSKTAMAEAEGARSSDGSIGGAVRSPAGKLLAGVAVTLVDAQGKAIQVLSSEAGAYEFASLKPGSYRIKVDGLSGVITQIPVESGKATRLDLEIHDPSTPLPNGVSSNTLLNPDMISEIRLILAPVDAEAGRGNGQVQITTKSGSHFSVVDLVNSGAADEERVSTLQGASNPRMNLAVPLFTPRLREYFPETLVWEPAVETDRDGRAELRFKLADNITAWKVETIASTLDGRIARGETEFLAFQPFFLEHEPPRILTEGDTIALPVTIRNYLATDQLLDIAMSPESWFTATGSLQQKTSVKAGETAIATFGFKATRSVKDAKQRITAIGTAASDSIEKPLTVHPNGREVSVSESKIVNGRSAFALDVPASALPGSTHAQIWIYPNLAAHIAGAIEGILERPHGCAEQVISSTYPSLMLLRVEKQAKRQGGLTSKARAYLENGYARLIGYQSKDGGFTYWGSGDSDIALTAYAVQFLADARDFIAIDENTLERAANWLASRQRDDGSWFDSEHTAAAADPSRALALTNTVAQALSLPAVQNLLRGRARESAGKALRFARSHTDRWTDPYGLAQLTLAALHQSDRDTAETALRRIEELARAEGDGSSWDLEGSSPFFGWGLPGRVESSALSIRALVEGAAAGIRTERTQTLIDRGLAFLMRHKDRYGVWFSTQATARALDTLSRYIGTINGQAQVSGGGPLEILIDGKRVHTMQLPRGGAAMNPIPFDISTFLRAGANRMEISSNGSAVTAQIVGTYYVPWTDGVNKPAGAADASDALQLAVTFDKTEGRSTDTFTAHVRAARGRSRGYGMMLAEIGLPPGAEVDRESLDRALAERGSLFRYEIRPDRVVAYLWPASGHADFQFSFHMRFGAEAESAPSILYDYYNPDDQVVQAPTRFVVR